jgi:outer membrane protein
VINRAIVSVSVIFVFHLVFAGGAAAQTAGVKFPHSLVISDHAVQAAVQAPAQTSATAPPTSSGPRVPLTVDEALKLALSQNLDISVQRFNHQTFDLSIASLNSVYNPVVTSTLSAQTQKSAPTSTTSGAAAGTTIVAGNTVFNGGVSQQVPWHGGSLLVNLNNTRQTTTSLTATVNPQYNSNWFAQYTQPLLRNFSIDSTRQQLVVTKLNQDISDLQLQQTIINTTSNVRNAYWDYVFAIQSVNVAQQSLNLAEELVKNNQSKVEIGTLAPIDVVQAQTQSAAARQALITAQGTVRTAEIALKRLIVNGTNDPIWSSTIDPTDQPEFTPITIDVNSAIQRALSTRTDVLQAKKDLEANAVTLNYLQDQTKPQADLIGRYQTSGVGGTRFITENTGGVNRVVVGTIPGGYGDALTTLFQSKLPQWNATFNFSYPLGISAQRAAVARAKVQQNQIDAQLRQIDLSVASDVSNAAVGVQNAVERVQAAQVARQLAQQQLDAENSKFAVGMSTNYLIVQAQRDLATAQNNELQAILAYRRSLVEFDRNQQTGNGGTITILGR